jgi:hypothetical protein
MAAAIPCRSRRGGVAWGCALTMRVEEQMAIYHILSNVRRRLPGDLVAVPMLLTILALGVVLPGIAFAAMLVITIALLIPAAQAERTHVALFVHQATDAFLVPAGAKPVTWSRFFALFAAMIYGIDHHWVPMR